MVWKDRTTSIHTSAVQGSLHPGPQPHNPPAPGQGKATFTCLPIQLESESNGTTAVNTCWRVLTGAITASIVDSTRFWREVGRTVSFLKECWYRYYCLTTLKAERGLTVTPPGLWDRERWLLLFLLFFKKGCSKNWWPEEWGYLPTCRNILHPPRLPADLQPAKYDHSTWQARLSAEHGKRGCSFLIPEASLSSAWWALPPSWPFSSYPLMILSLQMPMYSQVSLWKGLS